MGNRVDQALQLAADRSFAARQFSGPFAIALGQPPAFGIIGPDVFRDRGGMHQLLAQACEYRALDRIAIDLTAVAAGSAFRKRRALQPRCAAGDADRGHAAAAGSTAQQAGQGAPGLSRSRGTGVASHRLDLLRGLPCCIVNDAQMRRLDASMDLFGIRPRYAFAGRRILDHPNLVPDDASGIELVEQHAVAARRIAVDGGGVPADAARRRNPIGIEPRGDRARRAAADELGENPAYDLGLVFVDRQLARAAWNRGIAIGPAAGVTTVADHRLEAAARMHGEIAQEDLADHGTQSSAHVVDVTLGDMDLDLEKIEPLAGGVIIGLVAKQTVHVLRHDDVEQPGVGGAHQRLKAGAVDGRRARDRPVVERHRHRHGFARADLAAERDLIVDRFLVLVVGGKTGVDGGADHARAGAARARNIKPF